MKRLSVLLLMIVMMLLTACGQNNEAANETSNEQVGGQDSSNDETGKLVLYTSGPGGLAEKLAAAFEEETGIEVDMFQSTTGQVLGRLEAEQNNPMADVVILASLPPAIDYMERGLILPYESPYAAQMRNGWYDEDFHFYGFAASALGLSYNTNLVETPPTDWSDLLDESYKSQIAIPDPSQSGTARDFLAAYVDQEGDAAWEMFTQLKDNGIRLGGANNPALTTVINGANQVVMAGVDYMVYNNKAKGEPVDIVYPTSGTMITPRPAFILKSAQNVSSAQKYIDFILSDKGQALVANAYLLPGRKNVAPHPDRATVEEIALLDFDWSFLEENGQTILEEFTELVR
ncbi:ABC transporter substrate-binding protein [Alkalihalobacillus sp. BA299]|uniref:ABC transporter substrate-binding protein n=1 Tax=Alkalihalobacillus sp. BA299 TaxID=2815938 RepID=UPI001ADC68FD|nr:ABC transporter substrate-binding protein [Alkalihalobacillus sp. BA299]